MAVDPKALFRDGARTFATPPRTGVAAALVRRGPKLSITCRADGFTVRRRRFWRAEESHYRWDQVQWTDYRWREADRGGEGTFTIYAAPLPMVYVPETEIDDLNGLIEIFNAMTPHVGHTWERAADASAIVPGAGAPHESYQQVYRAGMAPWERERAEGAGDEKCCRCDAVPAGFATPEGRMCEICYIESR